MLVERHLVWRVGNEIFVLRWRFGAHHQPHTPNLDIGDRTESVGSCSKSKLNSLNQGPTPTIPHKGRGAYDVDEVLSPKLTIWGIRCHAFIFPYTYLHGHVPAWPLSYTYMCSVRTLWGVSSHCAPPTV